VAGLLLGAGAESGTAGIVVNPQRIAANRDDCHPAYTTVGTSFPAQIDHLKKWGGAAGSN
jgi:hypothetical protein